MLVSLKDGRDRNVEKGNGKKKKNSKKISLGHLYQETRKFQPRIWDKDVKHKESADWIQ